MGVPISIEDADEMLDCPLFRGLDVEFWHGYNDWNSEKRIADPNHCEGVANCGNKFRPLLTWAAILALKSWTAFPNHMRIIRKDVTPMRKLKKPSQADIRCTIGFSRAVFNFGAILWRKEIRVNRTKNTKENATATEMNAAGDPAGGESNRVGAFPGKTERSYTGEALGNVQLTGAALLLFAHEPRTPMKMLGPSIDFEAWGCIKAVDGITVSRATWSCRSKLGANRAKRVRKMAVRANNGDR